MAEMRHPYAGRSAVLATMHRKEEAIVPALQSTVGLLVAPAPGLDTDQLGTFTGEISRAGTMLDAAAPATTNVASEITRRRTSNGMVVRSA